MKPWKRRLRAAFFCCLLTVPALAWFEPTGTLRAWRTGEPFYRGRPASFWRAEILEGHGMASLFL